MQNKATSKETWSSLEKYEDFSKIRASLKFKIAFQVAVIFLDLKI